MPGLRYRFTIPRRAVARDGQGRGPEERPDRSVGLPPLSRPGGFRPRAARRAGLLLSAALTATAPLPATFAVLSATLMPVAVDAAHRDPQVIVGRLEWISVRPGDRPQKARIDTGAGLTSIDARGLVVEPAANGRPERATFRLRGQRKDTPPLSADVLAWVEIKGKGTKRVIRRPVIAMQLCIGDRWLDARVNLADRTGFLYPLLIGRDTLIAGNFLVDPAALYLEPSRCD